MHRRAVSNRLPFIRPLAPSAAVRPPTGDDWLHEPKWDGFRFQVVKDGDRVRLPSGLKRVRCRSAPISPAIRERPSSLREECKLR